jgi:hypothetical protein
MVQRGTLNLPVGEVLELGDAKIAHRMLDGAPHKPGKIVLKGCRLTAAAVIAVAGKSVVGAELLLIGRSTNARIAPIPAVRNSCPDRLGWVNAAIRHLGGGHHSRDQ